MEVQVKGQTRLIANEQSFDSRGEVAKLIHYVTGTGPRSQDKRDCICYGGHGVSVSQSVELAIQQFEGVYRMYQGSRKSYARRVYHEHIEIPYEYARRMSVKEMDDLAYQLSSHYWNDRYQVVYGVHGPGKSGKHFHIHFAVNMVNSRTGKKFDTSGEKNRIRSCLFNRYMKSFMEARRLL